MAVGSPVGAKPGAPPGAVAGRDPNARCERLAEFASSDHYVFFSDHECRLVVARRTRARIETLPDIARSFDEAARVLGQIERKDYRLLVDVRRSAGRNDEGFEAELKKHRGKLLSGFFKRATLVSTPAGLLQIQRYAKEDQQDLFATDSPGEAFRFLGLVEHTI